MARVADSRVGRAFDEGPDGLARPEMVPTQVLNPVTGGYTSGRVISAATTLTPPTGATKLLLQAQSQNVRYTLDGTNPTAAAGFQLRAGDPPIILPVGSGTTIKVIQEAATAVLTEQWCS